MKKAAIGILAHVDAGKTTLAEAMLYKAGTLRKLGRVDHGDTLLDVHSIERERGITVFTDCAVLKAENCEITLLDTPGHVDFSAEAERTLKVLDAAVLVINSAEKVQAHTKTLWKLLEIYNIPVFIFVTKMDFERFSQEELMEQLQSDLSPCCVDFSETDNDGFFENVAMCREDILEKYLSGEPVTEDDMVSLIYSRSLFPCCFGSGLKLEGIDHFISVLSKYTADKIYPDEFGAKIFKITHDSQGNRITHLKITGGTLRVRDEIEYNSQKEKIASIRIYNGSKFTAVDSAEAGTVCAVTGLTSPENGAGLGIEGASEKPVLEPVMTFRVTPDENCDIKELYLKMKMLEEEDPQLHISWDPKLREIHIALMGEIQAQILKSVVAERFGINVTIDSGRVLYKETVRNRVEGVGHYEPLRHYAEVHLILEPGERGSGIQFMTKCSEDVLDRNWQRLILMHVAEKQHSGVLTGSPITDIRFVLAAGRAHLKHTEGGDFRQATYRAIRQGLMKAESVLLEPYYRFVLEVPREQIGRAINDIRLKSGSFDTPEDMGEAAVLRGRAPVTEMRSYASEVASYTGGRGRISLENDGYDVCHDAGKVIAEYDYDPESDTDNPPDSVFCAHGSGFIVKWDKVHEYMHIESCLEKKEKPYDPVLNKRNFHIDDKELEAIMEREFGPAKKTQTIYRTTVHASSENKKLPDISERKKYVIVDGYNVIFAWDELKALADENLDAARDKLMNILCNYSAFTKTEVILVFDAYLVSGNTGKRFDHNNIHIVYTKEHETGDTYIEKLVSDIGKNANVRVVTSDGMIQLSALRFGVLRMPAREFEKEIEETYIKIREYLSSLNDKATGNILEILSERSE